MKRIWMTISVIWFATVISSPVQAQIAAVDHFRCYLGPPATTTMPVAVQLQDQFDVASGQVENITQLAIQRFCNPVQKTRNGVITPIVNVNHHLTMFGLNAQPFIMRQVVVSNQFGQQTLTTADARVLAVPTGKGLPPNPPPPPSIDLDHYKCYAASGPEIDGLIVNLKDQFTSETVAVLHPVLFCNPVKKTHNGIVTPIQHPDVHLTCYATGTSSFPGININILNQFVALNNLPVQQPDLLCVPSQKLQWSVVSGAGTAKPQR